MRCRLYLCIFLSGAATLWGQGSVTRLSRGLTVLANYTFAKLIDDGSGDGANPFNLRDQCGPGEFDIQRRFIGSHIWQLPKLQDPHALLRHVAGDPHPDTGRPRAQLIDKHFNTAVFAQNPAGTCGASGRNIPRDPGTATVDLGTIRGIPIHERHGLRFRAEMFNLFNRVNLGEPNANQSAATLLAESPARANPPAPLWAGLMAFRRRFRCNKLFRSRSTVSRRA